MITHDDVLRRKMDEAVKNIKKEKPLVQVQKKLKKIDKKVKNQLKRGKTKGKRNVSISSSESEESLPDLNDDSDYEQITHFCEDVMASDDEFEKENVSDNICLQPTINSKSKFPKIGDWLLVRFATKKTLKHYVGVVIEINKDLNPVVQYLRKSNRWNKRIVFSYPHVEDVSELRHLEDIALFLPEPVKERRGLIHFGDVIFRDYNIQ